MTLTATSMKNVVSHLLNMDKIFLDTDDGEVEVSFIGNSDGEEVDDDNSEDDLLLGFGEHRDDITLTKNMKYEILDSHKICISSDDDEILILTGYKIANL